MFDVDIHGICP